MQNQDDILNPDKVLAREKAEQELQDAARAEALDTVLYEKKMDEMFKYKERTEHPGIAPASMRIKNFKVKQCGRRNLPSAYPGSTSNMGLRANSSSKMLPSAKDVRPTTAIQSTFGISEAKTAFGTEAGENQISQGALTAKNARAASISRFSKFEENEK